MIRGLSFETQLKIKFLPANIGNMMELWGQGTHSESTPSISKAAGS